MILNISTIQGCSTVFSPADVVLRSRSCGIEVACQGLREALVLLFIWPEIWGKSPALSESVPSSMKTALWPDFQGCLRDPVGWLLSEDGLKQNKAKNGFFFPFSPSTVPQ